MSPIKAEDAIGAAGRPFTGAEYLSSLRDGREVYIYGERVEDVTTHPGFRNAARSIARLYDALHHPESKNLLTWPTDTGSGGFTHKFFRAARSRDELLAQRDAIAEWARMSYGWMGRSPDYKASLMNTLGANHKFYGKFSGNAMAWYRRAQEHVLFMNHAIVNPPVDRAKAADQVKDVFITIRKETDAGIYVSGAKVVATSSALTHYNFLGQNAAVPTHDTDLAVMFIAPMNAPGVKLLCRASYEMMASVMGTPLITHCPRVSTRTTPSSYSTTPSFPGRTCFFTAISRSSRYSSRSRGSSPAISSRAAPGSRSSSIFWSASSPRRSAPPGPTSSAAIRRCSVR